MAIKTYTKGQKNQLSKNFVSTEFDCKGKGCCSSTKVDEKLITYLQQIRDHFGKSININSGYRCKTHNANIGGASKSNHMDGKAADIQKFNGIDPIEIARYAESIGVLGIGVYSWGVHIDTRTSKYFWYDGGESNVKTFGTPTYKSTTSTIAPVVTIDTSAIEEKTMWDYFKSQGLNDYGIAGLMGNLYAESMLRPTNLQNSYEKSLGMNDAEYTAAVDNGSYTNFIKDNAGYGLAQWTYWSLKQDLLNYAKSKNKSIGDGTMQMEFLTHQLSKDYSSVWNILKNATTILEASNAVLLKFERPADQSVNMQNKRATFGKVYYDKFATKETPKVNNITIKETVKLGSVGETVKYVQNMLVKLGYTLTDNPKNENKGIDGIFGDLTQKAVYDFQIKQNLKDDGIVGKLTMNALEKATQEIIVKVTANVLNVRSGPSVTYKIVTQIKKNQIYTIVEQQNGWGKLKSGIGWISMEYVEVQ